jgi:hypothetical protein
MTLVTHDVEGTELTMDIPNGYVAVLDKDGVRHQGDLIDVDPSMVIIKPDPSTRGGGLHDDDDHQKIAGGALHLKNYRGMQYLERFPSREIILQYLLGGLGWIAKHDLFLDPINSRLVAFKTSAVIRNDTGVTFDLSSLRLAIGNPALPKDGFGPQIDEVSLPQSSSYMIEAKLAPRSAMMIAGAPPQMDSRRNEIGYGGGSTPVEMNEISDDGAEDYGYIDVGRQRLGQKGNFEILNLVNIPIETLYYFEMESGNTDVQLVYQFTVPEETHIPEGDVMMTSYDPETKTPGGYLGQSRIGEHFQGEEVDIKLGNSKLVKAECQIKSFVVDQPKNYSDRDEHTLNTLQTLTDVDMEELKEYADRGLFDFSQLMELTSSLPSRVASSQVDVAPLDLLALQEAVDSSAAKERKSKGPKGPKGPKQHLSMRDVQDITVLLKKDVPQIRQTKIHCSFTNNSSRMPVNVVATYPVFTLEKVVSMNFTPSRERKGKMEFDLEVPPNSQIDFDLEIVTNVPPIKGGDRYRHHDVHPAYLPSSGSY